MSIVKHDIETETKIRKEILNSSISKSGSIWIRAYGLSMSPLIKEGDWLEIEHVDFEDLKIGDVIATKNICQDNQVTTHRLIKKLEMQRQFMTKGDSNYSGRYDKPLSAESIIGKVIAVKRQNDIIRIDNILWRMFGYIIVKAFFFNPKCNKIILMIISPFSIPKKIPAKLATFVLYNIRESLIGVRFFRRIRKKFFQLEKVKIRPIEDIDYENIGKLIGLPLSNIDAVKGSDRYSYVVEYEGKIIGRICMHKECKGCFTDSYVIAGSHVSRGYRSLGVGEAMNKALIECAKRDGINILYRTIDNKNRKSINLAKKLGFKKTERDFKYKSPEEAKIYEKQSTFYLELNRSLLPNGNRLEFGNKLNRK